MKIAVGVSPYKQEGLDFALEADKMGVDSVWTAEAWGYDVFTPLAYLAARTERIKLGSGIAQLGARTPANLAMTAMSMHDLSNGRFILGIGTSGPQVIEGWHGVPFAKPLKRTRETIEILRMIFAGDKLAYDGEIYQLPLPGGEGKSIRTSAPTPADIPIYIASLGPANLRLTGELTDGWVGTSFIPETASVFFDAIEEGAKKAGRSLADVELCAGGNVEFGEDIDALGRKHAAGYGFTFGAMGSSKTNFYSEAFSRQGYGDAVAEVHRLWKSGDHEAARRAVPAEIGLKTNLVGTEEMIIERIRAYRDAGIGTLRVRPAGETLDDQLTTLGRFMDLLPKA